MHLLEESEDLAKIYSLLYRFGITANYTGFFHVSYAVFLITQQPDRLQLVTKWLYPAVAKHYQATWQSVERNIRTVIIVVWQSHRDLLCEMAGHPIEEKPCPTVFLRILAENLNHNSVA